MLNPARDISRFAWTPREIVRFQKLLLAWFEQHRRDLPWRRTRDPYAIWISEIMLQQTRVKAVIPFYQRFLGRFPDFAALAQAPEADLLAHWAGLGYYHRARNLQKAARLMHRQNCFPTEFAAIRALPGIGDYTSAAVASIAFGLPHAAVDGNVLRVLSRLLADPGDIRSARVRKQFAAHAAALLAEQEAGHFNQAMMELGATICLPKNPQCLLCPVSQFCRARADGRQKEFPVKLARPRNLEEERVLFWIEDQDRVLLWQRPAGSRLMAGFWELPEPAQLPAAVARARVGVFRHSITIHNYRFELYLSSLPAELGECQWVPCESLPLLPASTILRKAQRLLTHSTVRTAAAG